MADSSSRSSHDGPRRSNEGRPRGGSYGKKRSEGGKPRRFGNQTSESRRGQGHGKRWEKQDGDRRSYRGDSANSQRRHDRDGGEWKGGDRKDYRSDRGNRFESKGQKRQHSQRGGSDRDKHFNGPMRSGYREERITKRLNEPALPADIDVRDLDTMVLQDLKVLAKDNADAVAKHMIMAAVWMSEDPELALKHARAAKDRAGRVAIARETCGIAAYHAGEWKEALSELRAARRMSGGPGLIAVMADCERGLGRPEKAIELARNEDTKHLDHETRIELAIVVAGARLDLGQPESAVATLESMNPKENASGLEAARLSYAYADALLQSGRKEDAHRWFTICKVQDIDETTDVVDRLESLAH
ncbi:hypothetical protein CIP107524_01120 [Corynebacterium diphtheriae]|nr:hypothetical protein CIP107524_01120 [Corynebacterium diphtheriae]